MFKHVMALPKIWLPALLSLLFLCAGCAAMYVNPGPNPGHLILSADVKTDYAEMMNGLQHRLNPIRGTEPILNRYSDPLWNLRAMLETKDGSYMQLPLADGGSVDFAEGYQLNLSYDFLIPEGTHEVIFMLTYMVARGADSYDAGGIEFVHLRTWQQKQTINVKDGKTFTVRPFDHEFQQPISWN